MIYLYGLSEADPAILSTALEGTQGIQATIQQCKIEEWTLVFSQQDAEEILPKRRLLLSHTKVLEKMMPHGTVLPARFGLVASTLEEVSKLIASRKVVIAEEFNKVRDAIELGVRVSFDRQAVLRATLDESPKLNVEHAKLQQTKGAHFAIAEFGGRLAEQVDRRRAAAQRKLLAALKSSSRDFVLRAPEEDVEVLRGEFLVDAAHQDSFQDVLAKTAASLDFASGQEPTIQIIGPVPMYNFVRLNLAFDTETVAA